MKKSYPIKHNTPPPPVPAWFGDTLLTRFPLFANWFLLGSLKSGVGVASIGRKWNNVTLWFSNSHVSEWLCTLLKIIEDSRDSCLCGLFLRIFTMLEIKSDNILKYRNTQVHNLLAVKVLPTAHIVWLLENSCILMTEW